MSPGRIPRVALLAAAGFVAMALVACGAGGQPTAAPAGSVAGTLPGHTAGTLPDPTAGTLPGQTAGTPPGSMAGTPPSEPAVLLAVGDIATCDSNDDEAVARLVASTPGHVALLGDNAYPNGSEDDFRNCFAPAWQELLDRLSPVPGNHDYEAAEAAPYFAYFGARSGTPGEGWYAYDLGTWRIYALNSNCEAIGGCGVGSPQLSWLAADLTDHQNACILAYWHQPRFSSGRHGDAPSMTETWATLDAAGTDVILAGHDHTYERFSRLDASGNPSPDGPRSFVVGTGGKNHYQFENLRPWSAVRDNEHFGVLRLELADSSYTWRFLSTDSSANVDSGEASCS